MNKLSLFLAILFSWSVVIQAQTITPKVTATGATDNSLTFSWTDLGSIVDNYTVTINSQSYTVGGTTYTATGLQRATEYSVTVLPNKKASATETVAAGTATATTKFGKPSGFSITNVGTSNLKNNSFTVSWNWNIDYNQQELNRRVKGFYIEAYSGDAANDLNPDKLVSIAKVSKGEYDSYFSYSLSALSSNTTYYVRISPYVSMLEDDGIEAITQATTLPVDCSNLHADPLSVRATGINSCILDWLKISEDCVVGYRLYKREDQSSYTPDAQGWVEKMRNESSQWTQIAQFDANTTTYTLSNLHSSYRTTFALVVLYNDNGEIKESAHKAAYREFDPGKITPTIEYLHSGSSNVEGENHNQSGNYITIVINKPLLNQTGQTITSYEIHLADENSAIDNAWDSQESNAKNTLASYGSNADTLHLFYDGKIKSEMIYYVKIRPRISGLGNESVAWSNILCCAGPMGDKQCSNLRVTSKTYSSVNLAWDCQESNGVKFDVYVDGEYVATTATKQYSLTGLDCSSSHTAFVKPVLYNSEGNRVDVAAGKSNEVAAVPLNIHDYSTTLTGAASNLNATEASLSWNAASEDVVDNLGGYKIKVFDATGNEISAKSVTINDPDETQTTITGLSSATEYKFQITPVDSKNHDCTSSNIVSVKTKVTPVSNLTISNIEFSKATVTWSAHTSSNVTGYNVEIYDEDDALIKTETVNGKSQTSYNVTGLTPGGTYYVKVTPIATAGFEAISAKSSNFTTNLFNAQVSNLRVTEENANSIKVEWNKPTSTTGVVGYEYSIDGGTTWKSASTNVNTTSVTIGSLQMVTDYTVQVRPIGSSSLEKGVAQSTTATTDADFSASASAKSETEITISVQNTNSGIDNIDGYEIDIKNAVGNYVYKGEVSGKNGGSYTVTGLTPCQLYYFKVYAIGTNGSKSLVSKDVTATTKVKSGANGTKVTLNSVTATTAKQIDVAWTPINVSSVKGYDVYYCTTSACNCTDKIWVAGADASTKSISVNAGTTYYVKVVVVGTDDERGADSNIKSATTPFNNDIFVTNINVTNIQETTATVSWTAPAKCDGLTGYTIVAKDKSGNTKTFTASATATSYNLTGLKEGTIYTISITPKQGSSSGKESTSAEFSTQMSTSTIDLLTVAPTAFSDAATTIKVQWVIKLNGSVVNYDGIDNYTVQYTKNADKSGVATLNTTTKSAVLTNLDETTTYYIKVIAKNGSSVVKESDWINTTTLLNDGFKVDITVDPQAKTVEICMTNKSGDTNKYSNYKVVLKVKSTGEVVGEDCVSECAQFSGIAPGSSYLVEVVPYGDSSGCSSINHGGTTTEEFHTDLEFDDKITLSVGTVTATTADLSWTVSVAEKNATAIAKYQVYLSTESDFSDVDKSNNIAYSGSTSYSKTISSLSPLTKYYVKVGSVAADNQEGSTSDPVNFTTNISSEVKTGNNADITATGGDKSVKVDWTKCDNDLIDGYYIYYSTTSGNFPEGQKITAAKNATTATITGLAVGTKYYVKVAPYKGTTPGGMSNEKSAVTNIDKSSTFKVNLKSATATGVSKISVEWDKITKEAVTGYKLYYATSEAALATATPIDVKNVASYIVENLSVFTKYYFKVVPYDVRGNLGPDSNVKSAITQINNTVGVTNIQVTPASTSAVISWDAPSPADAIAKYKVTVNGVTKEVTTLTATFDNLKEGTNYTVKVVPVDAYGKEGKEESKAFSTTLGSLKVKNVSATTDYTTADLSFDKLTTSTAVDSYLISYWSKSDKSDIKTVTIGKDESLPKELTGLSSGTTYSITVAPKSGTTVGTATTPITATTKSLSNLKVTGLDVTATGTSTISASWTGVNDNTVSGVTYKVEITDKDGATISGATITMGADGKSATISGLTEGKEYKVKVTPKISIGDGSASSADVTTKLNATTVTGTAVYGQTLADIVKTGWVSGCAWKDASTTKVGNVGTQSIKYIYTAAGGVTEERTATIQVTKATPSYVLPSSLNGVFGKTLADITLPTAANGKFEWINGTQKLTDVGSVQAAVKFIPNDLNNYVSIDNIPVTVNVPVDAAKVDVTATANADGILVSWTKLNTTTIDGYNVYISKSATVADIIATTAKDAGNANQLQISGLDPSTTYYIIVRPYDADGNLGANSDKKSAVTFIDKTIGVSNIQVTPTATTAEVTWDAPANADGITGYEVTVGSETKTVTDLSDLKAEFAGLTPGTNYTAKVTPVSSDGTGKDESKSFATKLTGLTTDFTPSTSFYTATVEFTPVTNDAVTDYKVTIKEKGSATVKETQTVTSGPVVFNNLDSDTEYEIALTPIDSDNNTSGQTTTKDVTTKDASQVAVEGLTSQTVSTTEVSVSWTGFTEGAVADDIDGYIVVVKDESNVVISPAPTVTVNETGKTATISGLVSGKQYIVEVTPKLANDNGKVSSTIAHTSFGDVSVSNITVTEIHSNDAKVSWDLPDNRSQIDKYEVRVIDADNTEVFKSLTANKETETMTVTNLKPGKKYKVFVTPQDAAGLKANAKDKDFETPIKDVVVDLTKVETTPTYNSVYVDFEMPDADAVESYLVEILDENGSTLVPPVSTTVDAATGVTPVELTGLTPNTQYKVRLTPQSGAQDNTSVTMSFSTKNLSDLEVENLKVEATDVDKIHVEWDGISDEDPLIGAVSYKVEIIDPKDNSVVDTKTISDKSADFTGLVEGKKYDVKVTPQITAGDGSSSEESVATLLKPNTLPAFEVTYGQKISDIQPALPTRCEWENKDDLVGDAADEKVFTYIYTAEGGESEVRNANVKVNKAVPTFTVPTTLTGTLGDALSTVVFDDTHFSWVDGSLSLNKTGEMTFKATYTPDAADLKNYEAVEVDVKVTVLLAGAQVVISAAANNAGINVTWDKLSSESVKGYNVYYNIVGSATVEKIDVNDADFCQITSLSPSTTYEIIVRPYDENGAEGSNSNKETVTTFITEDVVVLVTDINVDATENSAVVTWKAPEHSDGITEYIVSVDGVGEVSVKDLSDLKTTFTGLQKGTDYIVRITPVSGTDKGGTTSKAFLTKLGDISVSNVVVTPGYTSTEVRFDRPDDAPTVDSYDVEILDEDGNVVASTNVKTTDKLPVTISPLEDGEKYTAKVTPVDRDGNPGTPTTSDEFETKSFDNLKVVDLDVTPTKTDEVIVEWNGVTDLELPDANITYDIKITDEDGNVIADAVITPIDDNRASISGLVEGKTYNVEVTPTIPEGSGSAETDQVTTLTDVPDVTGLKAVYGDKLKDVLPALPAGCQWVDEDELVGEVGSHEFDFIYTAPGGATVPCKAVVVVEKATPNPTIPTDITATEGDRLGDIELPDGFEWKNPEIIVEGEGVKNYDVIYTQDPDNYEVLETTIPVDVKKKVDESTKKDPTYEIPTDIKAQVGDRLGDIELPDGFEWKNPETIIDKAGKNDYEVVFTPEDTDTYKVVETTIPVAVEKGIPTFTAPETLNGAIGQKIGDILLPDGFSWANPDVVISEAGSTVHEVIYTPKDTDNYQVVSGINVTVVASKEYPKFEKPTDITAEPGDRLGDIELPDGFEWKNPDTIVDGDGVKEYEVIYTPEDTDKYAIVETVVDVTIKNTEGEDGKQEPKFEIPTDVKGQVGDRLGDIELPDGFEWKNPDTIIDEAGKHDYEVIYTPEDTDKYKVVETIVTVDVAKGIPTVVPPVDIVVNEGDRLGDIELPDGFEWKNPDTIVSGDDNSYPVIFVPEDTDNYESVEVDVTVVVNNVHYDLKYIVLLWEDVLVVDNSDNLFVAYQWYKNGEKIEGANDQFLNQVGGVFGTYEVHVKLADGRDAIIGPKTYGNINSRLKATVNPSPVRAGVNFTVNVDGLTDEELRNAEIVIFDMNGAIVNSLTTVSMSNTMVLPRQGIYIVVVTSGDQKDVVKLLVD